MRTLFIIAFLLGLAGCKKGKDDCTPASDSYVFYKDKTIAPQQGDVVLVDGPKTVFKYKHSYEVCPGVIGGYLSRSIYLEIPASVQTSFQISDSTGFANAHTVFFTDAPISSFFGTVPIAQGFLKGTRMGPGYWHLEGHLVLNNETVNINAHFREAE